MTSPHQIEILDIRHFTARQLRPLLEEEAAAWRKRLRWDYQGSTELLLQYLDSRILPGFVALNRGKICGFTFCVYEGSKAVVGDIYASLENKAPLAVTHNLTRHLLEVLEASPDIDRVEAQLLLFDSGVLPAAFGGFTVFPRLFLELEMAPNHVASSLVYPPKFHISPWAQNLYQASAELIQGAYKGHVDSEINDQYRTLHGSLRFLHNIIRFPGCGTFDPRASWVLRERATNNLIGILLCSRVAPDVAHVTQLCIASEFRGHALGHVLLRHCVQRLPEQRYRALTLTVSEANHSALRLYRHSGFQVRHRFDALVLEKPVRRERFKLMTSR